MVWIKFRHNDDDDDDDDDDVDDESDDVDKDLRWNRRTVMKHLNRIVPRNCSFGFPKLRAEIAKISVTKVSKSHLYVRRSNSPIHVSSAT